MGEVKEVTRGHSDLSGAFVVEDIHPPGAQPIRRLIFLGNQAVVQSEARILIGEFWEEEEEEEEED